MSEVSQRKEVQRRIANIENELSERIRQIQEDANRQILAEVRRADEALFTARLFLLSVADKAAPDADGTEPERSRPIRQKSSGSSASGKSSQRKSASSRKGKPESVRISILRMLVGAPQGVAEAEIDASVIGSGLSKDASRKAKGFARKAGVVEVRDGTFFITQAGRDELQAKGIHI